MSNHVTFQLTKFINLTGDHLVEGSVSYGYRVYDDYEQFYNNIYETSDLPYTPQEALDIIRDNHPDMYDFIVDSKQAFYFNDEYVQVKPSERGVVVV